VFDFVPTGLFSRLLVKLLHVAPRPAVLWRNGIIFRRGSEQIFIELQGMRKTILIRLRGHETDNLRIVVETLESLTQDFYQIEPEIYVPCVHCMEDNPLEPFMFPLSVCENAAISGKPFVLCNGQRPIRVDTLVPDIAMSEVASALLDFGELRRDRRIGKGGYSVVYQGRYRGEVVAIKRIKLPPGQAETEDTRREAFRQFRREVWLMSGLDHPNIVSLKGFCITPICLVTEYLPYGNLYDYLHDSKRMVTWPFRLRVAMDVAKGCAFLHATKPAIIHRDLKSPNILLASVSAHAPVVAKVTDFGVSQILVPTTIGRAVACPVWLAPEVIKNEEYSEKADVYSFGVMLWELLVRREFFGEIEFLSELQEAILDGKRPAIPDDCLPSFARLVRACWSGDADARPSFPVIIDLLSVIMEKQNVKASCDLWGADLTGDTFDELSTIDDHPDTRSEQDSLRDSDHDEDEDEDEEDEEDDEEDDDAEGEGEEEEEDTEGGGAAETGAHVSKRRRRRQQQQQQQRQKRQEEEEEDAEVDDDDMMPMVGGEARASATSPATDRRQVVAPHSPAESQRHSGSFKAVGSVIGGLPQHPAVALLKGNTSPGQSRRRRHSWVYDGDRKRGAQEGTSLKYSLVAGDEDEFDDQQSPRGTDSGPLTPAELSFASASPMVCARRPGQEQGAAGTANLGADAAAEQGASGGTRSACEEEEEEANTLAMTQPSQKTRNHRSAFRRHLAAPLESSVNVLLQVGNGSLWVGCSDGTISVLDVDSGEVLGTQHAHFDRIFAMVNVDDHTVWTSSKDGTVRVWSSRHALPKLKQKIRLKGMLAPCLLVVDRQMVWAGTSNGRLLVFDTRTGKLRKQVKLDVPVVQCMVLTPDLVWVGADRMILRVHPRNYKVHGFVQGHKRVVHSMVVCGDTVWSCSSDKSIRVWDQVTAQCLNVLEGHTGRVFTLLAEGDQYVWSAGWDTSLIVWNAQTRVFAIEHRDSHSDAVSTLCLVRGRTKTTRAPRLCAGSWDKLISVWSMHTPPDVWARLEWAGATESGRSTARIGTPRNNRVRIPAALRSPADNGSVGSSGGGVGGGGADASASVNGSVLASAPSMPAVESVPAAAATSSSASNKSAVASAAVAGETADTV
jgi:serine/threonine protein kinase/WD40 repeat protein